MPGNRFCSKPSTPSSGGGSSTQPSRLIREGAQQARIEAHFSINEAVARWMEEQHLDSEDGLVLSRDWRLGANRLSSRSRLNGLLVSRQQMMQLRPMLVDFTAQGQSQMLAQSGWQRFWLDAFAGDDHERSLVHVASAWRNWSRASEALERLTLQRQSLGEERRLLEAQLQELDAAGLDDPYEAERLQQDQDRLAHAVILQEGVHSVLQGLRDGVDPATAAMDQLALAARSLHQLQRLDPGLADMAQVCADCSDPASLAALQERLAQLRSLERRHGLALVELIRRRDTLRSSLQVPDPTTGLKHLAVEKSEARQCRDEANAQLHQRRARAARRLEDELLEALSSLGLASARFEVDLQSVEASVYGTDRVCFLFTANPGQPLAPLAEVASGGEISRFLLVLKASLARSDAEVSLVFDEIDTGVSGRVSEAITRLLRRLAKHRQVFCVTHQPLLAAAADHHFRVSKVMHAAGTTIQVMALLDRSARRAELAELAGGGRAEAHEFAAHLLDGSEPVDPVDTPGHRGRPPKIHNP